MKKRLLAGMLCVTMVLGLASCGKITDPQIQSENLMEELQTPAEGNINPKATLADYEGQYPLSDFGIRLMQQTMKSAEKDENVLISPLSVLLAFLLQ